MSSGYGENSPHGANSKAYNEGVYWKKREERLKAEKECSMEKIECDGVGDNNGFFELVAQEEIKKVSPLEQIVITEDTVNALIKNLNKYLTKEKPFEKQFTSKTHLLDILYFLGYSIDEKKFYAAQGFGEFKKIIIESIGE